MVTSSSSFAQKSLLPTMINVFIAFNLMHYFFARDLQEEYERLKSIRDQSSLPPDGEASPGGPQNRDSELLAEAKLLRQHKGRLEARMQVLEDHNRQLEAQLQRLRQLLDQVQANDGY